MVGGLKVPAPERRAGAVLEGNCMLFLRAQICCHVHTHANWEAVLNHVVGRDTMAPSRWPTLLFWGRFVGSDRSSKVIRPGSGWAHFPPPTPSGTTIGPISAMWKPTWTIGSRTAAARKPG